MKKKIKIKKINEIKYRSNRSINHARPQSWEPAEWTRPMDLDKDDALLQRQVSPSPRTTSNLRRELDKGSGRLISSPRPFVCWPERVRRAHISEWKQEDTQSTVKRGQQRPGEHSVHWKTDAFGPGTNSDRSKAMVIGQVKELDLLLSAYGSVRG